MKRMLEGFSLAALLCLGLAVPAHGQVGTIRVARTDPPVRVSIPSTRYPEELRRQQLQGTVMVEARVDSTGFVEPASVRVLESPDARFNEAAKEFVLRSRYRPGRAEGKRVAMFVRVPVTFDLYAR